MSALNDDFNRIAKELPVKDGRMFVHEVEASIDRLETRRWKLIRRIGGDARAYAGITWREANAWALRDPEHPVAKAWTRWHCAVAASCASADAPLPN